MSAPITWPQALPLWPLFEGFSHGAMPGRHAFEPSEGLPIARPKQTARVDVYSMTFGPLSQDQVLAFRQFHDVTLGMGSLKFAMVHPLRRVVWEAQFVGEPAEALWVPGHVSTWRVSMQVMMIDVPPAYAADVTLVNGFVEYTGA